MRKGAYQIFLVEDHAVVLESYCLAINEEPDMAVCGTARCGREALEQVPRLTPDLVLVDLSLPDIDGFDVMKQLQARNGELAMVVVSGHHASHYRNLAIQAGALAFIDKMEAFDSLVPTIRSVLDAR